MAGAPSQANLEEIIEENLTEHDSTIFCTTTKKLNEQEANDIFKANSYGHSVIGVPEEYNP